MSEENVVLTKEQAIERLPEGEEIHTFLNPSVGMLIGADWPRADILELLNTTDLIHETGKQAQAMDHGIAAKRGSEWVFIETKKVT